MTGGARGIWMGLTEQSQMCGSRREPWTVWVTLQGSVHLAPYHVVTGF